MCDGTGIFGLVGRRDISSHCCTSDLCNLPVTTTMAPTTTLAPSVYLFFSVVIGIPHVDITECIQCTSELGRYPYAMATVIARGIYYTVQPARNLHLNTHRRD